MSGRSMPELSTGPVCCQNVQPSCSSAHVPTPEPGLPPCPQPRPRHIPQPLPLQDWHCPPLHSLHSLPVNSAICARSSASSAASNASASAISCCNFSSSFAASASDCAASLLLPCFIFATASFKCSPTFPYCEPGSTERLTSSKIFCRASREMFAPLSCSIIFPNVDCAAFACPCFNCSGKSLPSFAACCCKACNACAWSRSFSKSCIAVCK